MTREELYREKLYESYCRFYESRGAVCRGESRTLLEAVYQLAPLNGSTSKVTFYLRVNGCKVSFKYYTMTGGWRDIERKELDKVLGIKREFKLI